MNTQQLEIFSDVDRNVSPVKSGKFKQLVLSAQYMI